jgi:hypothetical protein
VAADPLHQRANVRAAASADYEIAFPVAEHPALPDLGRGRAWIGTMPLIRALQGLAPVRPAAADPLAAQVTSVPRKPALACTNHEV